MQGSKVNTLPVVLLLSDTPVDLLIWGGFETIPSSDHQGFLLSLLSGVTPDGAKGVLGMESGLMGCKTSALPSCAMAVAPQKTCK